jgi:L-alanine-DL-glutamate epimerase-like enolase superfamily enzyme
VRIHTLSGEVGLGEVPTDETSMSRCYATACQWLDIYGASIVGEDSASINAINERLDAAEGGGGSGGWAARAAIEMAVYDLVGRLRGCPLHKVLGGSYRNELDQLVEVASDDAKPAEKASAAVREGFAGIRLTMSRRADGNAGAAASPAPAKAIVDMLDAVGDHAFLDVVARQSLGNEAKVSMFIESLLGVQFRPNLALVQPLHWLDLEGHARLRQKLPVPIVLEDSITSPEAMLQVVRRGAADRIVLDVWRVGGLRNARRIASICESAAIGVTISGACRTPVGRAALCHLAATIHGRYPISLGPEVPVADHNFTGGPSLIDERIVLGSDDGLGVTLH